MGFETDLTGYYLRRLQARELVEKVERGSYRITPLGKSVLAHRPQLMGLTILPRTIVLFVASCNDRYIVVERAIQPFIGRAEWPALRLLAGELLHEAASRIATTTLGVQAEPQLRGFFRRIDMLDGDVFDDKLFAVHRVELDNTQATNLLTKNQSGKLLQLLEAELTSLPNRAKSLLDILDFTKSDESYGEHVYNLKPTDLYK